MALIDRHKPLHVSIVGGEPLVRYRELGQILPQLAERGIHTQVVTSAVRPIPAEWAGLPRLQIVVSIDGLPARTRRAAHAGDLRAHPQAHRRAPDHGALHGHAAAGAPRRLSRGVPRLLAGESEHASDLDEPVHAADRRAVDGAADARPIATASIADLRRLRQKFSKLQMPEAMLNVYAKPPESPEDCIFAQTTECFSSDLERRITPCQFGGNPDCNNCGCMASAGLEAIGRHRLKGGIPVGRIFYASVSVGKAVGRLRGAAVQATEAPVQSAP